MGTPAGSAGVTKENTMAKYLLLKHYRGAPAPANDVPMDQWRPDEVEAHIQFMNDFAARLESSGEFIEGQALSPDGVWVRSDGEGRPAVSRSTNGWRSAPSWPHRPTSTTDRGRRRAA